MLQYIQSIHAFKKRARIKPSGVIREGFIFMHRKRGTQDEAVGGTLL